PAPSPFSLSLHDALPISAYFFYFASLVFLPFLTHPTPVSSHTISQDPPLHTYRTYFYVGKAPWSADTLEEAAIWTWHRSNFSRLDRKSTRLNSSHVKISH